MDCKIVLTERPKIAGMIQKLTGINACKIDYCQAGHSFFCIEEDGSTYPCPPVNPFAQDYRGADILTQDVDWIWNSAVFESFRRFHTRSIFDGECENCRHRADSTCRPCDCWPLCKEKAGILRRISGESGE